MTPSRYGDSQSGQWRFWVSREMGSVASLLGTPEVRMRGDQIEVAG